VDRRWPVDGVPAGSTDATTTTEATGTVDDFNDADVAFAQGMIPHHEQAVAMAELALDPTSGAGPAVLDLAARIEAGQGPEIELMTGWLTAREQPLEMDMGHDHDMSAVDGMMSAEDMEALAAATGADFDRLWTEMMIDHHEGAITSKRTAMTRTCGHPSPDLNTPVTVATMQARCRRVVHALSVTSVGIDRR
jgi:uncharacterized protein (DUF305 family)